jgi:hypothetical protein
MVLMMILHCVEETQSVQEQSTVDNEEALIQWSQGGRITRNGSKYNRAIANSHTFESESMPQRWQQNNFWWIHGKQKSQQRMKNRITRVLTWIVSCSYFLKVLELDIYYNKQVIQYQWDVLMYCLDHKTGLAALDWFVVASLNIFIWCLST